MTPYPAGDEELQKVRLARAFVLLNRAFEMFYEKRYEQCVEVCAESLGSLLPERAAGEVTPEQQGDLFVRTYSSVLPVQEAEKIAGVFTFFQRRSARFKVRPGGGLPREEWWNLLRVNREEAEVVLQAARLALNAVEGLLRREE